MEYIGRGGYQGKNKPRFHYIIVKNQRGPLEIEPETFVLPFSI